MKINNKFNLRRIEYLKFQKVMAESYIETTGVLNSPDKDMV